MVRIGMALGAIILLILGVILFVAPKNQIPSRKHNNVDRLSLARLQAVHNDVHRLKLIRIARPSPVGWNDFKCIFHAHAEDSAHTGGTLPEMLADAKKAGIHAIFLTDHFRPPRDFIDGRWRGLKEGVLFVPGSEVHGFLIHPMESILDKMSEPSSEFIKTVTSGNGLIFLSHIEERPDHSVNGLTGLEIYNRHWDAKKDFTSLLALALKLTDPVSLADLEEAIRLYPDELLAFQCDYPQVYLDKWDSGTVTNRLTGIAANDCHHNQVFVVKMVDENTVLLGTVVDPDDKMQKITSFFRSGIKQMTKGRKPGDILARVDADPYHRAFKNVCTHVLATSLDESSLRASLKAGHAYVAHDWMCDATGFTFEAMLEDGIPVAKMGDEAMFKEGLKLVAKLPLPAYIRLMRQGREIARSDGTPEFSFEVKSTGVYRLEAWLKLDGELRPWIYSNPIYVR